MAFETGAVGTRRKEGQAACYLRPVLPSNSYFDKFSSRRGLHRQATVGRVSTPALIIVLFPQAYVLVQTKPVPFCF